MFNKRYRKLLNAYRLLEDRVDDLETKVGWFERGYKVVYDPARDSGPGPAPVEVYKDNSGTPYTGPGFNSVSAEPRILQSIIGQPLNPRQ